MVMNDYSLAILVGRLTRDPELKYTNPGGIPYLRMSIAVNRQVKSENAEPRKTVSFVDVSVWRRLAELCAQFLKKGRTVMVVGSLRQSRWTGKDGAPRARIEVMAERVQFLGPREAAGVPAGGGENGSNEERREPGDEEEEKF
jgi:single-strand DNA-binding protein